MYDPNEQHLYMRMNKYAANDRGHIKWPFVDAIAPVSRSVCAHLTFSKPIDSHSISKLTRFAELHYYAKETKNLMSLFNTQKCLNY